MNLMATGTKALVVPFTGGGNTEQTIRAQKLAQLGVVGLLSEPQLRPDYLAERMIQALQTPPPTQTLALDQDGAMKTATCLQELVAGRTFVSDNLLPESFSLPNGNHRTPWQMELRENLALIQAEGKDVHIFFRDDDIDEDEETLIRLLDLFLAHGAPLNLAVIPDLLTDATVKRLHRRELWIPESLGLIQHGWRHVNHEQEGRKCEFGISRSLADKFNDIARGKSRLEEAFGPRFYPAFTPPGIVARRIRSACWTSSDLRCSPKIGERNLSKTIDSKSFPPPWISIAGKAGLRSNLPMSSSRP